MARYSNVGFVMLVSLNCALVGCTAGSKSPIGMLSLSSGDSASIRSRISSSSWPSRIVYFEPVGSSMSAYSEPVYDSTVTASLRNLGSEEFSIESKSSGRAALIVPPGKSVQLAPTAFKNLRIVIVPPKREEADVQFTFSFDKTYSTRSTWHLVAAWSDGP